MGKSIAIVLSAVLGFGYALPAFCQDASSVVPIGTIITPRTISTSATFAVEVPPNQVLILMGVKTSHADLSNAKSQNDERTRSILATAKAAGVASERVQTGTISITPKYPENRDEYGKVLAYVVERKVVIDLRDMSKFENLISECLKDGANYIYNIEFRTTDLKKHRMLARKEAAKAAREKADVLAVELATTVGKVRTITEYSPDSLSSYSYSRYGGAGPMVQMASNASVSMGGGDSSDASDGGTTMSPGHLSIRSTVTVVFDLQ